jgi:hypothetical protein
LGQRGERRKSETLDEPGRRGQSHFPPERRSRQRQLQEGRHASRAEFSTLRQGEQRLKAFSNPEGWPELRNRMRFLRAFVPKRVRGACWDHSAVTRAEPDFFASNHEYKLAGQHLFTLLLFGVHVNRFGGAGPIV